MRKDSLHGKVYARESGRPISFAFASCLAFVICGCSTEGPPRVMSDAHEESLVMQAEPASVQALTTTGLASLDSSIVESLLQRIPEGERQRERSLLAFSESSMALAAEQVPEEHARLVASLQSVRGERYRRKMGSGGSSGRPLVTVTLLLVENAPRDETVASVRVPRSPGKSPVVLALYSGMSGARDIDFGLRMIAVLLPDSTKENARRFTHFSRAHGNPTRGESVASAAASRFFEDLKTAPKISVEEFGRVRAINVLAALATPK